MHSAIIGLGEAGSRYAAALVAAGHQVTAFDPRDVEAPDGINVAASEREAVTDADLVLVLTSAAVARKVAETCAPHLKRGAIYADMTSSAPAEMESLATHVEQTGAHFADVAILGPVTVAGAATPLLVSGSGATSAANTLRQLGAKVNTLDAPAGAAMAHKLLRSVFMKGLASLIVEAVSAGEAANATEWIRNEITRQLAGDGQAVIDRFLTGTRIHAERRGFEMEGAHAYLSSMGVPAEMTSATVASLKRLANQNTPGSPTGRSKDNESDLASSSAKA
ncbi:3-hydroxyisobutyrate dehydrogenase-like beta-hydroxyacid dehydrogenase [Arthrobacter pigmenti]|uniref:3-hydroxyisobutyrate dehydrogenase-like beta-hydroxyacid dehydrogenase n=1 Tax=Arthrobacter pigmenti TaxID=271432 RepID=A0A846RU69_9MICC|nr:NAD(P)-binding domain-containing protein [Arthrobacter pigmenti]NJC23697.1 3-hydroxyisobutyrate dehydrogenase-like beta-hydroxyacid dehydrogenase [Arthrobacter pigmenti]